MNPQEIKISKIQVQSIVNQTYVETKTILTIVNSSDSHYETSIILPIDKLTIIKKIRLESDVSAESKVIKKQKAEEKYSDSLAEGNTSLVSFIVDGEEDLKVCIGNVKSRSQVKVTIYSSVIIGFEDKSYCYINFPNKLPSLTIPSFTMQSNLVEYSFECSVYGVSQLTRLTCRNYDDLIYSFNEKMTLGYFSIDNAALIRSNFAPIKILFRVEQLNQSKKFLYEQFDPVKQVYAYSLCHYVDEFGNIPTRNEVDLDNKAIYSNLDNNIVNDYPGCFVFLIDQSGSMSGSSITLAKEALKLFIKSLPMSSRFDIIGFGSTYVNYFNFPLLIDETGMSIKEAFLTIDRLAADLGGTDIHGPMQNVFENVENKYSNNLAQHLFILTDGQVSDSTQCLQLASKHKDFKLHAVGIGSSVDKSFLKNLSKVSCGTYHIAEELSSMKTSIISALNSSLMPYYTDLKVSVPINTEVILSLDLSKQSKSTFQDSQFCYLLLSKSKIVNMTQTLAYSFVNPLKNEVCTHEIDSSKDFLQLPDGDSLSKFIVGASLNYSEEKIDESRNVELSLSYQVLCPLTSLFLEIINTNKILGEIKKCNIKKETNQNSLYQFSYPKRSSSLFGSGSTQQFSSNGSLFNSRGVAFSKNAPQNVLGSSNTPPRNLSNLFSNENSCMSINSIPQSFQRPDTMYMQNCSYQQNMGSSSNIQDMFSFSSLNNYLNNKQTNYQKVSEETPYNKLLFNQNPNGSWSSFDVSIFNLKQASKLAEIKSKLTKSGYDEIVVYTSIALLILHLEFKHLYEEHKMIFYKAQKYLESKGLKLDQILA